MNRPLKDSKISIKAKQDVMIFKVISGNQRKSSEGSGINLRT